MKINKLTRQFHFKGIVLEDPNLKMTVGQVKDFYANEYPELTNAVTTEKTEGDKLIVKFDTAVGKKG